MFRFVSAIEDGETVKMTLTERLLKNRGVVDAAAQTRFLEPSYDEHLHDPFLMKDMDTAVRRVLKALKEKETIAVYSDYDCDGIPGGVLFHDFLKAIGHEHFFNYIPHRHEEGYGFNEASVETLKKKDAALIITIDCGITDIAATKRANEEGIDVIVTDHHEPGKELPPALAVLDPKRKDNTYPFTGLCGSGVAFKLITALITKGREENVEGIVNLKEGWEKWWLDVVGLATIADMVPLVDENRVLARYGLEVLRKSRRPGLQHLLRAMRVNQRFITEDDIGFMIGPRINAASRMDNPEDAFHTLATTDEGEAGERARHLERLNNERKGVVAAMVKDAKKRMEKRMKNRTTGGSGLPPVLVVGDPSWRPSLAGLVANTLAETHRRPAFVWGRDGNDVIKGSCRSDGVTSVVLLMEEAMQHAGDVLLECGGHHMSGGFSVSDTKIHKLEDALSLAHEALRTRKENVGIEDRRMVDAELSIEDIDEALVRELATLAPFGMGNDKPLFIFKNVTPKDVQLFGKGKEHTKLLFDRFERAPLEAIAFFMLPEQFTVAPQAARPLNLLAHVEHAYFMNRFQTRLRIVDVL